MTVTGCAVLMTCLASCFLNKTALGYACILNWQYVATLVLDLLSCFQVALTAPSGSSRGFAFVDMSSAEEAERAQLRCSGVEFAGQEIRVSFGMPCRPGACILQHRNTVPYNVSGQLQNIFCRPSYIVPKLTTLRGKNNKWTTTILV